MSSWRTIFKSSGFAKRQVRPSVTCWLRFIDSNSLFQAGGGESVGRQQR